MTAYQQKVAQVAQQMQADGGLPRLNRNDPSVFDGVAWTDIWDYVYGAMSESDPHKGGFLTPAVTR